MYVHGIRPQGDQIGRIFARWVTHYFGYLSENDRNSANNWATFFYSESFLLVFTKNGLGYIVSDFFTNASGHPVRPRLARKNDRDFHLVFLFQFKTHPLRLKIPSEQGCQILLYTIYQNGVKYTKLHINYQIAIKYTNWP
jgi:hypothetical protein